MLPARKVPLGEFDCSSADRDLNLSSCIVVTTEQVVRLGLSMIKLSYSQRGQVTDKHTSDIPI